VPPYLPNKDASAQKYENYHAHHTEEQSFLLWITEIEPNHHNRVFVGIVVSTVQRNQG
jgi:hypothetical protein